MGHVMLDRGVAVAILLQRELERKYSCYKAAETKMFDVSPISKIRWSAVNQSTIPVRHSICSFLQLLNNRSTDIG